MPKQSPAQLAEFQRLCRENGLDPETDVWKQKQSGQWIIGRTGIEKIQGKNNIAVSLDVVGFGPDHAGVKATATRTVKEEGARTAKKLVVESTGSAHPKNCTQISYYLEMAEKRAKSRAILMLMGFSQLGIYGEDEADDFQRRADSLSGSAAEASPAPAPAQPAKGNDAGGSPTTSEPPPTPAASSSAVPVASAGADQKVSLADAKTSFTASEKPAADANEHLVKYATGKQKEEIITLLNNPVITRQEKTKMLLNINRLDEERAEQAISKLRKAIEDREGDPERKPTLEAFGKWLRQHEQQIAAEERKRLFDLAGTKGRLEINAIWEEAKESLNAAPVAA